MSKEVISHKMQQKCDGCGKIHEWELVGADRDPLILTQMQEWFTLERKAIIRGEMRQIITHACSVDCTSVAALKMLVPPEPVDEPTDQIDLASLRVN